MIQPFVLSKHPIRDTPVVSPESGVSVSPSRVLVLAALVFLPACGESSSGGKDPAGLATVFDSTADTIHARVNGDVDTTQLKRLVQELAIAPGVDDTTLFTDVSEFDVDRGGRMWVFDRGSNAVMVFGADGKLVRRIGRKGAGPGEFASNGGMVVLADTGFAQWDPSNARISFLDTAGVLKTTWRTPGGFSTSNGLLTDNKGGIWLRRPVTPAREQDILGRMGLTRPHPDASLSDSLVPPDIPMHRDSYVASNKNSRSSTNARYAPNYFWAWHPDGWFIIADGGKHEITLLRKGLKPVVIHRTSAPVAVTEEERAQEKAAITYNLGQVETGWRWKGADLPTTKAPLLAVFAARDGRIWTRVAAPSELIPEVERSVPSDTLEPVVTYRTPNVYEVYEADGRFVGRVAFPPRARLMEADGDRVWAIVLDESDVPAIVRFRMQ